MIYHSTSASGQCDFMRSNGATVIVDVKSVTVSIDEQKISLTVQPKGDHPGYSFKRLDGELTTDLPIVLTTKEQYGDDNTDIQSARVAIVAMHNGKPLSVMFTQMDASTEMRRLAFEARF